jgi:hypothetical protein
MRHSNRRDRPASARKKGNKPLAFKGLDKALRIRAMLSNPSDPDGIRTRVAGVKGQCPRPLDDGAKTCLYSRWGEEASRGGGRKCERAKGEEAKGEEAKGDGGKGEGRKRGGAQRESG